MAPWLEKTTLISMIWPIGPPPTTCSIGPLTRENYAHKYDLTKVHAAYTPVNWPKDSQKYDLYINEGGMYDMGISGGDYDED